MDSTNEHLKRSLEDAAGLRVMLQEAQRVITELVELVDNPRDAHYPILSRQDVRDVLNAYRYGISS